MADIAQRGNRLTRTGKFGGGRTNLLEELGRVEAEPSNRNRRAEISRVHGELNRGYAKGGTVRRPKKPSTHGKDVPTMAAEGGRIGLKHGTKPWGTGPKPGSHEYWMQDIHKKRKGKAAGGRAGHFAGSLVKNIPKLLKKLGTEIKAQPLPPQLQKTLDEVKKLQKLQKTPRVKKAEGGRAGHAFGSLVHAATKAAKRYHKKKKLAEDTKKGKFPETESLTHQVGPYVGDVGSERKSTKWITKKDKPTKWITKKAEGGRIGLKKGGSDKKWIQKAVNPKHKGYCTPMTKKTCTPARKALARTFKKKAKTGW